MHADEATFTCDGNVVVTSVGGAELRDDCGSGVCVAWKDEQGTNAICSLDGKRDARCGAGSAHFCDGDRAVICGVGYPIAQIDCAAKGLVCGEHEDRVGCVVSRDPDPHCHTGGERFCNGNFLMGCLGDMRMPVASCIDSHLFCREQGTTAACVMDVDPDPRCTGVDHFCDGTVGWFCFAGHLRSRAGDCAEQGKTCVSDGDVFECR